MFRRIWLEALRTEPAAFATSLEDYEEATDDDWRRSDADPVFVAFQGSDPVGITGMTRQRGRKMAHRARVGLVYIRPALRRTGLARLLLEAVISHARGEGVWQLELAVSAENPAAMRLYQREGFVEVGRVPSGFLHESKEIDDVLMVRRLTD